MATELQTFSYRWLDWLKGLIIERSGGLLTDDNVFDERDLNLEKHVQKALSSSIGYCCGLSLVTAENVAPEERDNIMHQLSCEVQIVANRAFCKVDTTALAEQLYMSFVAAYFDPIPGIGSPTVTATSFSPSVSLKLYSHTFRLQWRAKVSSNN